MPRICVHLDQMTDWKDRDYVKSFSGRGIEYALICVKCSKDPDAIEANLCDVSEQRFSQIEDEGCWEWDKGAIVGQPEVRERPTTLLFHHEEIAPLEVIVDNISAIQPVANSPRSDWIGLDQAGGLWGLDLSEHSAHRLATVGDGDPPLAVDRSLHVAADGTMAAVVETRGQFGVILDLNVGWTMMRLDRGGYRSQHSHFPVAFFHHEGRLRLVHGTKWNRLDISDPRTGELLTQRTLPIYRSGERLPEHLLDYFHGGLAVSPSGEWIADNGWVWHPVGIVTTWNLRRWLETNTWESEDGPTRREPCCRHYFWDGPLCWIDDRSLAVWGFGNDDENLIPAALIFDVESGRLVRWFAGPIGSFGFDRYLFAHSPDAGTTVWDVMTGERLLYDESFFPTAYHPGTGEFVSLLPGGGFRMSRLVGGE